MVALKSLAVIMGFVTPWMENVDASTMRRTDFSQERTVLFVKTAILDPAANVAASMVRPLERSASARFTGLEPIAPYPALGCLNEVYRGSVPDMGNANMGISTRQPPVCVIPTTTLKTAASSAPLQAVKTTSS